jgi:cyclophilin family peptidyl-prolyl cis-trans isomerase
MAQKKRERYTERTRPHRKGSGGTESGSLNEGLKNPMVLVAVGGLILAVFLALGFLLGRDTTPTETAQDPAADEAAILEELGIPTPIVETGSEDEGAALDTDDAAEGDTGDATEGDTGDEPDAADAGEAGLSLPGDGEPYAAPDDMGLLPGEKSYFATIETDRGPIVVELWPEVAPAHVNAFAFLADDGFYDGLTFHRVEPGFVIQGGDPLGTGSGGPGYALPAEFNADNPVPHRIGTLAMARSSDEDSGGSQFYIVLEDGSSPTSLDGKYTVFGHVISGMDAVQAVQRGDVMISVTFEEKDFSERVVSPDDIRNGDLPQ